MENVQYRHEHKFTLNLQDALIVQQRLRAVLRPDPHAGPDGKYLIRSLYFDDMDNHALQEKLDGLSRRAKYRIRLYNGDDGFIRLEKKVKVAGLGTKVSAPLTRAETEAILCGDLTWMAADSRPLLPELYTWMRYGGLRPRTLVDYTREPFLYAPGNVRVTLDSEICSGMASVAVFSGKAPTVPAAPGVTILEVKYDHFLPEPVQDIVQLGNRMAGAFSKYAACRLDILY